jgi:hypothetical protein
MVIGFADGLCRIVPHVTRQLFARRLDPSGYRADTDAEDRPSFDLLRAAVNLMVASAVISYATSQKLPLSTTYVTFMVAMGTSFADRAWGRESAVYRVSGVLTVIGGWFLTALVAFTVSGLFALLIFHADAFGLALLVVLAGASIWRTHHAHRKRTEEKEQRAVFDLKRVTDSSLAVSATFSQVSHLLREIRESLDRALEGLFAQNEYALRREVAKSKRLQVWVNMIIANVFKTMRLLDDNLDPVHHKYPQTVRRLQKLADGHRDIVVRAHQHVSNYHAGLLDGQVEELRTVRGLLHDILVTAERALDQNVESEHEHEVAHDQAVARDRELRKLAERFNREQIGRINDKSSKTRLSILFYAIVGNAMMISKQNLRLLEIFNESFGGVATEAEFDFD